MSNKNNVKDLEGLFIYHDNKNRTIYSNPFQKDGYIITNKELGEYILYSNRLIFAIAIPAIASVFTNIPYYYYILIGLIIYLVTSALFYFKFLPSLPIVRNFNKPKRDSIFKRNLDRFTDFKLLVIVLVGILASILLIWNILNTNYTSITLYGNYIIIIFIVVYTIFVSIRLGIRLHKQNKNIIQVIKERFSK